MTLSHFERPDLKHFQAHHDRELPDNGRYTMHRHHLRRQRQYRCQIGHCHQN